MPIDDKIHTASHAFKDLIEQATSNIKMLLCILNDAEIQDY